MQTVRTIAVLTLIGVSGCSAATNSAAPAEAIPFVAPATQPKEIVLQRFTSPTYRNNLPSPLTPNGAGGFYGTTSVGGAGYGTLYELSPNGMHGWSETVLHTFKDYLDGGYPAFTPLVLDKAGNIYGTANNGGPNGLGVAFQFHRSASGWVETVLHNFGGGNAYPFNTLIVDPSGNLYGTDNIYHDGGGITEGVYEISPSKNGWLFNIIYDIGMPAANGVSGGLVMDGAGNIFGLSTGLIKPAIVFELKPAGSGWSSSILYRFKQISTYPLGAPVLDRSGNMYGTTEAGGSENFGSVYKLHPVKSEPWKMETLYSFKGGADGSAPYAGIVFDHRGNIYGTTMLGGPSNAGTVFELAAGSHSEKIVWAFEGNGGREPMAPVIVDGAGDLFGTTSVGGGHQCIRAAGCGNAYEVR